MSSVVDFRAQVVSLYGMVTRYGGRELVIPLPTGLDALCLHVTLGPSLDEPCIHAWLDRGHGDADSALLTIDTPLRRCAVVRDGLHSRPSARVGDARFVIGDEFATLLEQEFSFASTCSDD